MGGFGSGGSNYSPSPNNIQGDATVSGDMSVEGTLVVNESGNGTSDFRAESDNNEHMFFVDASANRIGIGTSAPQSVLHIVDPLDAAAGSERDAVIILKSKKEVGIKLIADSANDNDPGGDENNPYIDFYQDGVSDTSGRNNRLASIAMEGPAGTTFTDSLSDSFFLNAFYPPQPNSARSFQIANSTVADGNKARITVSGQNGYVGINTNAPEALLTVSGSEIAAMNLFQVESALDEGSNDPAITVNQNADGRWFMSVGMAPQTTYATQWNISNGSSTTLFYQNGNIYYGSGVNLVYQGPTVPASSTAAGATGQISYDSNYIYICTAGGIAGAATWKRVALVGF